LTFVLDSSVALSWCFEDEHTTAALALLERVTSDGAVAPASWPFEVLHGLSIAERRGSLDHERIGKLTGFLRELPIRIDPDGASRAWTDTAQLARRFDLSLYDAAYLELARRLELPLGTLDGVLRAAALVAGIPLIGVGT
jgi:predicted nucleic acid-binding protein